MNDKNKAEISEEASILKLHEGAEISLPVTPAFF